MVGIVVFQIVITCDLSSRVRDTGDLFSDDHASHVPIIKVPYESAFLSGGDSVLTTFWRRIIRPSANNFRLAMREQHAISLVAFPCFVATKTECNTLRAA